ncbi:molybdopterin converting factor subunit 1 [Virgibacillus kekensis]|uniref:Molybdopterin synthase sulfur carrier subunit n=1 Tax=Virgibacillus kekensis TaxID=202261 RepID=A0ABV9DMT8_9BACI
MIDVLFFAELQEKVGSEKVSMEADGLSVADLKQKLTQEYSSLKLDHAMIAVNEEYAQEATVLNNGDTVAFIPPVSGG